MKRHLLVLAALLFWFGSLRAQTNFINQDSIFARTSDCAFGVGVCIDSIGYDNINDLRFLVNGRQFSAEFTPCLINTVHNYSYSDIFRGGERGPWRLDSWTVNGRTYSGTFRSLQALADSMMRWNPEGNWQFESSARIIFGYVAASSTYSCQEISGTQKGGKSQVCYNSGVEFRGLRFNVPVGINQLIVEKVRTGERDTVTLLAACLKPETITRNIAVGSNATYCASQSDLLGTLVSTRNICPKPANNITFGTPRTSCITYAGTAIGKDTACIQVCDRYGFCDTTYLIVTAAQRAGNSLTFSDTISVGLNRTTCEVALPTGTLTSFTNICPQNSGNNVSFQLDAGTSCVTYRGLVVGTNTACIRACNADNVCDTTNISIQVIPYVAPRPATRFTYSDTITVGLTRNKCSFNAPAGAITTFENICAGTSGTNARFTLDQATKCVAYTGVAIGRDTACIRVCNAALQCDTTYMYISAIVNGTGGGTNNGTGRKIIVRDTISVGTSRENCGVSVPSTIFSIRNICPTNSGTNVAFSIDNNRRCVTYRGLTVGVDSACYEVCNANGVCDTTIYIVGTNDTTTVGKKITIRDTITVGSTRRDCRVSIPRGTYGGGVNYCAGSSGTNVTFVYTDAIRCVDITGLLVGSDTACIKVCNTNNICDTTIYIITAVENPTNGGGNRCGLRVTPVVQVRSCGITGFINLAVSGSTAPYTFKWADLAGAPNQPQNRTGLEAGNYVVTVSSATACDTTLTVNVANNAINCGGGGVGTNRCGLAVVPTATSKTCATNGAITLNVTGSTAPYTFNWADLVGTSDPKDRTNLEAGIYSVTVTPSTPNCDTIIAVVIANNATNCGGGGGGSNRCGLAVTPTATPKTCTTQGAITLAVTGSTAPYIYDWSDLVGTNDIKDRTALEAGTYTVKVTPSVLGCDTTLSVVVANNATNCGGGNGSNVRNAVVNVQVGETTTFCVDSTRVGSGFAVVFRSTQMNSVITETTPKGCFSIRGFVVGSDSATIILVGQNNVKDTTILKINVTPRLNGGGCGLVVTPTATPKTCTAAGAITLAVTGSTAPYTYDWSDLTGANDPKDRTALEAGTYTVKVTPSVSGCDTTLSVVILNNATNCGGGGNGSNIRLATVTVQVQDSTTYCVDSSRVLGGFSVALSSPNAFSVISETTPKGCFKVKGFVVGTDVATIILTGQNGVKDTTTLTINVTPRNNGGGGNRCGLAVTPTATPKTCTAQGAITLAVTGSTAPYTYDWSDLTGTNDVKDRTALEAGTYTVKVTPSVSGCDTTLSVVILNNANNCGGGGGNGSNIRYANVTVRVQDTATYCVDTARVGAGFLIAFSSTQINSIIAETTPRGCFKIRGFVVGRDTALIILIGQNGTRDTTQLAINVVPRIINPTACGLVAAPTATAKTCVINGSITLTVSGSTAPYTFDWSDIVGTSDAKDRTDLPAGVYTVKVSSSVANCDTTLNVTIADNCVANRCGLVVLSTATPKTCTANGTISIAASGSTGPYTYDWSDLVGTNDVKDRTNLAVGIYTLKVTPSVSGCDTTVSIAVVNSAFNCGGNNGSNIRYDSITVRVQDSVTYCVDSSRVLGGFLVALSSTQIYSNIEETTPKGCFKIKGFVVGTDTATIVLIGQNGTRDTLKLAINVTPRGGGNACGLLVRPTVVPEGCFSGGSIALNVSGSTAPYFYDWSDLVGTTDPKDRLDLTARSYTVKVTSSALNCDTTLTIVVGDNCVSNRCGLLVSPVTTPQTCTTRGTITLPVIGSTGPYTFDWSDLVGTVDPQNRSGLRAGSYTVKVTPSVPNCDTTLTVVVANDSVNCLSITRRVDSVTVFVQDSATYCADSSRSGSGFLVNIFTTSPPIYSVILPSTPSGCFKIKGFVPGRDTVFIILINPNGRRDTTELYVKVVPKIVAPPTFGGRPDTITIKILESYTYCPDTSRLAGSPVTLIKFCSTAPFDNTRVRLDEVSKCVVVTGLSEGVDTFCIELQNAAGFRDTTKLFVKVTRDTVTPVFRTDTVRVFVGDSLTYCSIDTGQVRGAVDTVYNACTAGSGKYATVEITPQRCLKIKGLLAGIDSACAVVLNRVLNLRDTTKVIIIVSQRPTIVLTPREDSITVQVDEVRNYCPDTSRLRGNRVTSIAFCSTAIFDNATILLVDSTKCAKVTGTLVGRDTACLVVCAGTLCDTVRLKVIVVPERPLASSTVIVPIQLGKDSSFCGIDTTQLRGTLDTIYDACPGKNGLKARMIIDQVTHCVKIAALNVGTDTMCVVVCRGQGAAKRCDTTFVVAVVTDTAGGRIVVIANDDFDSLRRGTNKTLSVYANDTIRPRRATSLTIVRPPVKGKANTISVNDGLIKYESSRAPSACGLDSFTYRVCIDSICDTAQVVMLVVCPDSLRTYTAISPNGDGRNDVFLVDGLQNYPNHTVCIFNRWGNQVLNQKNYQNDWSGTWNGSNVPDGTYFFFIRDDAKNEMILTGYIQVLR